jgi:transcriptional regulator with XRE-family HTH domain
MSIMISTVSKRQMAAVALKAYRMKREWTLEQMSRATKLHPSTIHKLENGVTTPRELTLARLERMLPDLFPGIEEKVTA